MNSSMGVPPMSPTGVSPVANAKKSTDNTGETPVRLTGKMPVLRFLKTGERPGG